MLETILSISLSIAVISAGLMAGVYFAFSGFIIKSFDLLGATQATDVMNSVNQVILRSWFMVLFFGSTLLYALLAVIAVLNVGLTGRWLLFATGLIYVLGMFICTAMFNVPLNNRLAQVKDNDPMKPETWPLYFKQWSRWNHLRFISCTVSSTLILYYLVAYW